MGDRLGRVHWIRGHRAMVSYFVPPDPCGGNSELHAGSRRLFTRKRRTGRPEHSSGNCLSRVCSYWHSDHRDCVVYSFVNSCAGTGDWHRGFHIATGRGPFVRKRIHCSSMAIIRPRVPGIPYQSGLLQIKHYALSIPEDVLRWVEWTSHCNVI